MPSHLNFITGNANKLREVKFVLDPAGIEVRSQSIDIEEVQGTIEEVTKSKCKKAAETVNGPVLVEDTALCYKALGDLPGPYIKWFMAAVGHDGLNNLLAAYEDKSAEAVCTFGYCEGWDAVFEYNGKTFAEMEKAEKSAISHRGIALKKLQEWFNEENTTLN
ncbi:inosine triphosphatase [Emericellopsis cladophorae]|uniref:Inosine triphosphate pyrophosphatase n=1 Tax=Emericellopsis cladophorae TaxID=2686198 RepID=A0A9P9Y0D4_9HYPO|nr:inosine triphosphatase [Emericellopsis cladophorae]KAI6781258.1 inosine triphosphatase [Emericellopsis cladophorae]